MTENNFKIDSAAISDKGLSEKRPQNEDSFLEMNARGLFAVADGVGGAQAGDVASQMAVEILSEAFANLRKGGDAEEMMKIAIERANEAIYQMSHDLPQLSTMATTIVALQVSGNIATIGHVGDSRLYRLDAKGNLYRETNDHSVVEEEVRAGRMTAAQAANHPSRNVISRALGADATVEVDMKTIMFEPNTTFLLCSDGITRHIDDFQIRDLLMSGDAPASIARKMKEICYERGAEDNLTAVIATVTSRVENVSAPQKQELVVSNHDDDEDEQTITAVRPPAAIRKTVGAIIINDDAANKTFKDKEKETPTGELKTASAFETVNQTPNVSTRTIAPEIAAPSAPAEPVEKIESVPVSENKVIVDLKSAGANEGSSAFLKKFLNALLWLIIGGVLGAGLYYVFERNNRPPAITEMQTPNIAFSAFEENRRNVDRNPQQYIAASTAPPEDAEDFYLLGRAYLYAGRFADAKQMFVQARDRLAQTNVVNEKVLANDIETGLIIADVPAAQDEFKKTINLNNSSSQTKANTGANVNANIANR
ncbi:MAG: protein phosphatase 2C domain-containing protein [Acidobacteriota bacterium]|nr:protein phosphatase 2C domain-containing protein [Acidobacteriota bacterium]